MELANLATKLDKETKQKIAKACYEEYIEDDAGRQDWLKQHAEYLEVFNQTHVSESRPIWGSTESLPLLTEAVLNFQARGYKALFPSRNFISALPLNSQDPASVLAAENVAKHMSYQLGRVDRNYKRDKNTMLQATALHGSDFTKTFYDPREQRNRVMRVPATDLIVPYGNGPRHIEDIERKTHRIEMSLNEVKILADKKYFTHAPEKRQVSSLASFNNPVQDANNQKEGLQRTAPRTDSDTVTILEQHRLWDLNDEGIARPYICWVFEDTKELARMQVRYAVDESGEPVDEYMRPKEYFHHYQYFPNPQGFYGMGHGHLLAKLNVAINKMLRQIIDAGTLANIGNMSGLVNGNLGLKGGALELELGQFIEIPRGVEDIRKALYQFQFPGPNAAHYEVMKYLEEVTQRLGSTVDAVTGDVQKVLQPLTIMTMLESALQMPTSVLEQMTITFEEELQHIFELNRQYIDVEMTFLDGEAMGIVTPQDYAQTNGVIPILDPRMITKEQRLAKAQAVYGHVMNDPAASQNPDAVYEASKRVLEAMDTENIDAILPPKQEQEVLNIDNQAQENMYFMMQPGERPLFDVFPEHNHPAHLMEIDSFLANPMYAQSLSEEQHVAIQTHRQKHLMFLYAQEKGLMDGQGGPGAMAGQPGNEMGIPPAPGALPAEGGPAGMPAGPGGAMPGAAGGAGLFAGPGQGGLIDEQAIGMGAPQ